MAHVVLPITSRTSTDDNDFQDVASNDQAIIAQVNGSLDSTNLADNAVTSAKITNSAVTSDKVDSTVAVTNGTNTFTVSQVIDPASGNALGVIPVDESAAILVRDPANTTNVFSVSDDGDMTVAGDATLGDAVGFGVPPLASGTVTGDAADGTGFTNLMTYLIARGLVGAYVP